MVFAQNGRHPREGGDPGSPPANAPERLDSRLRGNDVVCSGRPKPPNATVVSCKRLSQSAFQ
ncbi:hypothetical protein E6C67_32810 [Azospirillum sp. TSA2s]|nr:hypothetical protein E6C67_32810 [Azospirillum sp. TSA2s]